jgi:hypothetical protein
MKSLNRHLGELTIDHRVGFGLPEHVALQAGYDPEMCKGGKLYETSTFTCKHCKDIVVMNKHRIRTREYCRDCDHWICDACHGERSLPGYQHTPFEKKVDAAMESAHRGQFFDVSAPIPSKPLIIVP